MIKKIGLHIYSFIFMLMLLVLVLLFVCSKTILKKDFLIDILNKNNYYQEVYNNVLENFDNNLVQSGLGDYKVEEFVSLKKVTDDINIIIDGVYDNKDIVIDTTSIKEALDNKINSILKENNRVPSQEEKNDILTLENTIIKVYQDEVAYSMEIVNSLTSVFNKIISIVNIVQIVVLVITIILLLVYLTFIKNYQYLGSSCLAGGLILIIVKLIIDNKYQNILMLNQSFSNVVVSLISEVLGKILLSGIIISIIGLIFIILGIYKENFHKN